MKTVAELAKDMNISTQALYKKIKACNLTVANGGLIVDNHINHVTPHGEAVLKGELQPKQPEVTNQVDNLATNATNLATNLATEITTYLKDQVKIKDDQIAALQTELNTEREHSRSLALELAKIANQSQILQLAATNADNEKKPGFFKRIFSRNNG